MMKIIYIIVYILLNCRSARRVYNVAHDEEVSSRIISSMYWRFTKAVVLSKEMSRQAWLSMARSVDRVD